MPITKKLIPFNFTKGRQGQKPRAIVLHLMAGTLTGTDAWFRNKTAQASTHYGVGKKGEILQWVEEADTAWGNGRVYKPTWRLVDAKMNPNLYCVTPETPILMRDFSWKPAGELKIGDKLLAFDEEGKGEQRRHFSDSYVEHTGIEIDELFEITLENGDVLRCNGEHKWLVDYGAGHGNRWMKTADMEASMKSYKRKKSLCLSKFFDVHAPASGYKAGYLAAAYDGEGHVNFTTGDNKRSTQIGFSQKDNSMLATVKLYLRDYGFTFNICWGKSQVAQVILNGTRNEVYRFLQLFRPKRLLDNFTKKVDISKSVLLSIESPKIMSVRKIGKGQIVMLQTSSKTYIANGYGSHNTISIEHEGVSGHIWTPEQYAADVELIKSIAARWNIPLDRDHIVIHSEIYALKPDCAGKGLDLDKLMSMLVPTDTSYKNKLIKGKESPAVYWVDDNCRLHPIPTWEMYLEFFGGEILVKEQKVVDAMAKGLPFKG